jgi:hypothetical protein
VIVVVPGAVAVTIPVEETVETEAFDDAQGVET